tara:strand:+ start:925 stop:1437 length:513 start_codon:yes stop_codon:yes gene_type:complete
MATVLFINRTDLVRNSILDGNVDTDKFIQFIKTSQVVTIQQFMGTKLYEKMALLIGSSDIDLPANSAYKSLLNEYIQPMLIWYAQVDYVPFAAYQIRNGGIYKHSSENSETVSKEEVDFLIEKCRTQADWYSRRFIDFMAFNQTTYPEYTLNTNDDLYPSYDAVFNGWNL